MCRYVLTNEPCIKIICHAGTGLVVVWSFFPLCRLRQEKKQVYWEGRVLPILSKILLVFVAHICFLG